MIKRAMKKSQGDNKFAMRGVSKSDLERMYFTEKLSQSQIAQNLNVTQGAVFYWMRKYGMAARSHDDSLLLLGKSKRFSGDKNPRWRGGRHLSKQGYVFVKVPDHPLADGHGYVREHRFVWHEAKGPIPKGWHIHHKNGDKTDNRLENLELMTHRAHRLVLPELLKRIHDLETKILELQNDFCSCRCKRTRHDSGSSRSGEKNGL